VPLSFEVSNLNFVRAKCPANLIPLYLIKPTMAKSAGLKLKCKFFPYPHASELSSRHFRLQTLCSSSRDQVQITAPDMCPLIRHKRVNADRLHVFLASACMYRREHISSTAQVVFTILTKHASARSYMSL
jgi:hypothetical protein